MRKFFEITSIVVSPENLNWFDSPQPMYFLWPIQELQNKGFYTEILSHSNRRESKKINNIKFEFFPSELKKRRRFSWQLVKYVLKENPDIIYCHELTWSSLFLSKKFNGKKIIITHYMPHSTFQGKLFFPLEARFLRNFDKVLVLSEWEKNELQKYSPRKNFEILPHPIFCENFLKYKKTYKKRDETIFITVSRVHRQKGLDLVAKVWPELEEKYKIKWYIVGSFTGTLSDKKYMEEIRRLTNYSKNVIFTGFYEKNKLIKILLDTDIYIQPSRYECFGLSLVEAQALGLPVITTNVTAIPYTVSPNNFLIDLDNIKQLKEAMITLIENEKMRKEIGKKNRNFVKKFDYEKIKKRFLEIVEELMES